MPLRRFLILAFSAALLSSCSGDCLNVCEKWSECVAPVEGGVDACADQCEEKSDNDPVYQGYVEKCWNCAEDKVCSEASQSCAFDCFIAILR